FVYFFFFSSRRRHTRFSRDWSSDVCSSDLTLGKSEVQTSVPGFGFFPFPVSIIPSRPVHLIECITQLVHGCLITQVVIGNIIVVTNSFLLARNTIAQTKFEIGNFSSFKKIFFSNIPCKSCCREKSPTVFGRKS